MMHMLWCFFYMNKVETLMYELVYECMMKVPLFFNFFFFSQIWMMYVWLGMNLCMKHALMYFFTFYIVWNLFQLIPNLLLFLDFWNLSVLIFSLKSILWSDQFIEKLFPESLLFEHYLSDIHEIAKDLRRDKMR